MTGRSTDASLLARLDADAIEHLWVAYHDYGGRASGQNDPAGELPRRRQRRRRLRDGESGHDRRRPPGDRRHAAGRLRRLPGRSRPALLRRSCHDSRERPAATPGCARPMARSGTAARGPGWQAAIDESAATSATRRRWRSSRSSTCSIPETTASTLPVNTTRMFSQAGLAAERGLRRARRRRAAGDGRDRRPARQGVRPRSVRDVGPPRRSDPRRRRLLLAQGRGARRGPRARLRRDLHAEAVCPLGRQQPPRAPQPLGRRRRAAT